MRSWTGRCSIDRRGALRVLVTGGAGFIGGHLTEFFKNHGADVTVLDDLSGGTPERLPPGVELAEADIADASTEETVRRLRPEVVVHAAAQVSVVRSVAHPARDHAVNVDGTRHVLAGAAPSARRVVFLSSGGAVYGEANLAAEDDPVAPESPYGKNKLAAERLVTSWGIPYAIARLANVYGPGQRSDLEGGVVAVFIDRRDDRGRRLGSVELGHGSRHLDQRAGGCLGEGGRVTAPSGASAGTRGGGDALEPADPQGA
jgi:UDP-glucose 4-epimerase